MGIIMEVKTKWFGAIDIQDDKIITFDKGLIGLEEYKKYTIVYNTDESDSASIMWLQSLEDENLALPVMYPEVFMPNYDPIVEDELISPLGEFKIADLIVLVTLTVPSDITKMTSNLKAPIIINSDNMKACQLIADNENYKVKYPIYDIIKENSEKGGE